MFNDFIRWDTAPFYKDASGTAKQGYLLWGDGVEVISQGASRTKVRARGRTRQGYVANGALGGQSLLEFYFIDVGQGDGILIKTPDFKHIMIDGGYQRSQQDTLKNAADFVDWKFYEDYGKNRIDIDAMIASHNDADHYGGLWDLLNVNQADELDCTGVRVEAFYHAGLAWWKNGGSKTLGTSTSVGGVNFHTRLMGNRNSVLASLGSGTGPKLHGWWADFMTTVTQTKRKNGSPTPIQRLSHVSNYLPGFDTNSATRPAIKVLAPVEFSINGQPAIRKYSGGTSINTNGNSLLLRVDFGHTRTLLTGDLNSESMLALLNDYPGMERFEFACDVAKACHHGSEDISYSFLQAMTPAVTVISSGDNEGHDHPRPSVVAASATTGHIQVLNDRLVSPLIYSTELARSLDLGVPKRFEEIAVVNGQNTVVNSVEGAALRRSKMHITNRRKDMRYCRGAMVVGDLIYGLVNIRTDGSKILCATMDEKGNSWRVETLTSRF